MIDRRNGYQYVGSPLTPQSTKLYDATVGKYNPFNTEGNTQGINGTEFEQDRRQSSEKWAERKNAEMMATQSFTNRVKTRLKETKQKYWDSRYSNKEA